MLDEFNPQFFVQKQKPAVYGKDIDVKKIIKGILSARGIEKLYSHQVETIKALRKNRNVVLMAPTAAGKTECYMIPVIEAALEGKRSLLIFPTKALSRDQWNRIKEFNILGVRSEVYDGDISTSQRKKIRENMPHVIITNMDMLHFILSNNMLWRTFFSRLRYVVIDEIHAYSGTLGSHLANLIWRLKRLTQNKISFVTTSATIANPVEFSHHICSEDNFVLIEGDGAPRGKINHGVISCNGKSLITTSLKVTEQMDKKTIIFANSHNVVERLGMIGKKNNMPIGVYRSGLLPEIRRDLERDFATTKIKFIAATSALELGMDIGDADAVVLAGFPGTITRLRQRIGRVGRKGQESYAILICRDGPLDQYYAQNPANYLTAKPEGCFAKMNNEYIRKLHLLSAVKDRPLQENELDENDLKICKRLEENGFVRTFDRNIMISKEGTIKVRNLSMRNASERIKIIDAKTKKRIGERGVSTAISELYEGAIYLIGGKKYRSLGMDIDERIAIIDRIDNDEMYYTQALKNKHAEIISTYSDQQWGKIKLTMGKVHITNEVYGYIIKDSLTQRTITKKILENPLYYEFDTNAFWADWDVYSDENEQFSEGLHALEHVSIAMMPAISGADSSEIGGISQPDGRIYYYEGIEGGSGISEIVMPRYGEIIEMAKKRLEDCKCESGCPSCIFSPQCGNNNYYLDKKEALNLAKKSLDKK